MLSCSLGNIEDGKKYRAKRRFIESLKVIKKPTRYLREKKNERIGKKQEETGRNMKKWEEIRRNRNKQEETGTNKKKQEETERTGSNEKQRGKTGIMG